MIFSPQSLDLSRLFRDPDMFNSRDTFRSAGFEVLDRSNDHTIMVGRHKSLRGYLFKKYAPVISLEEQHENYARRIECARRLLTFIDDRRLRHVVVPQKWLHELPRNFSSHTTRSYVLIVERLKLLDSDASKREYGRIDKNVLRDLCTVLFTFRGLDSTVSNVPFTNRGQIAFVDTDRWDRQRAYLPHISKYLSRRRRALASKIFEKLELEGKGKGKT